MQFIESGKPSTWEWDVTPLKSGTQSLEIKVSVIVNLPERGEKQKDYPVLIKKIKVEVDPKIAVKNFIVENWRWAAAIVGVSGLVLTYLKNIGYFGNE
jgi:putative IMPACT (imprinted ancient) family translation regulator